MYGQVEANQLAREAGKAAIKNCPHFRPCREALKYGKRAAKRTRQDLLKRYEVLELTIEATPDALEAFTEAYRRRAIIKQKLRGIEQLHSFRLPKQ